MNRGERTRERYRKLVNRKRAIPGERFALRTHSIERVVRFASSARDDISETVTPIVEANGQPPRIRWLTAEELTVGQLNPGTCEVGPITPAFGGGGTDIALLRGEDLGTNDKLYFRITGPHHADGALYRRFKLSDDKALHYTMQLVPVEQDTP
jgi:hypothetical protein